METKPKNPKEIDVFNRFSKLNKLKIILIGLAIAVVSFCIVFFFVKSILVYTISYEANGGLVYGEEITEDKYHFLQKSKEPVGLKKEGFYIEGYYKDSKFTQRFNFNKPVWGSVKLYVNWQPGFAVQLFFAEGEEDKSEMKTDYLKLYHEQYVKPGSTYTLKPIYNDIKSDQHAGEQLLFYVEGENKPVDIKTFKVDDNIQIYGHWFDTKENKFDISSDGMLNRYLGVCDKIMLPSTVKKFRNIDTNKFSPGIWNTTNTADGSVFSVFDKVLGDLKTIYINAECEDIGDCAFRDATSLKNVYFEGSNISRIGKYAFAYCESLLTLNLPTSVTTIDDGAFYGCGANGFNLSGTDNVSVIGESAFARSKIIDIEFKNVQEIKKMAFASCLKIKTITLAVSKVVQTNVTESIHNIMYGNSGYYIKVPSDLVETYKTTAPWSAYATRIVAIEE